MKINILLNSERKKRVVKLLFSFSIIMIVSFMVSCGISIPYVGKEEIINQQAIVNLKHIPIFISLNGVKSWSEDGKIAYKDAARKILEKKGFKTTMNPQEVSAYYTLECSFTDKCECFERSGSDWLRAECRLIDTYTQQKIYTSVGCECYDKALHAVPAFQQLSIIGVIGIIMVSKDSIERTMLSALAGFDKFPETKEQIFVDAVGIDDGIKEHRRIDYDEALLNAKMEAAEDAGVLRIDERLVKHSDNNTSQQYIENIEKLIDTLLLPGFTVEDWGYNKNGDYTVHLKGYILKNRY